MRGNFFKLRNTELRCPTTAKQTFRDHHHRRWRRCRRWHISVMKLKREINGKQNQIRNVSYRLVSLCGQQFNRNAREKENMNAKRQQRKNVPNFITGRRRWRRRRRAECWVEYNSFRMLEIVFIVEAEERERGNGTQRLKGGESWRVTDYVGWWRENDHLKVEKISKYAPQRAIKISLFKFHIIQYKYNY